MNIINDLFSHKIHSSSPDWPSKLIDIATIFSEFDGMPYDRSLIENKLSKISPRTSLVSRDPSKFRDEISAYPAYLGIYRIELVDSRWKVVLSETAKKFLISEEPDVATFLLLQLTLFQYPNGMGAAYSGQGGVRIQSNAMNKTLDIVKNKIYVAPFRLICLALQADSEIRNTDAINASITYEEAYILANNLKTNRTISPEINQVKNVLEQFRAGIILKPESHERRFHLLNHTNFLIAEKGIIKIIPALNKEHEEKLLNKLKTINSIKSTFYGFDGIENSEKLTQEIRACSWGKYFDGIKTLESTIVNTLSEEFITSNDFSTTKISLDTKETELIRSDAVYKLREINFSSESSSSNKYKKIIYTDPEITKIKRQRANLSHRLLLELLYDSLKEIGVTPLENEHIDLYAELADNKKFVFEVKSISTDNLLSQTRKGVSQLYEYRYRYKNIIGYDVNLFLVYPHEPKSIPWLQEYLCTDRGIGVLWFEEDKMKFSPYCREIVTPLINRTK